MRSSSSEYPAVAERLCAQKAHGTKFGIDRMRVLAAVLGHPERRVPCIHVAGTNGKGSVAAMLDSILQAAGWRTGLYTSPHLVHLGERVQVKREPLSETEIVDFMKELEPIGARIAETDPNLRPSFFEYVTAMAFLQFERRKCDIAVYEVGLGGRLDATNVVVPEVAAITSIGLDHCEILGHELAQIAAEKAGIIKPGVPVVVGRMPPAAEKVIRAIADRQRAPLTAVGDVFRNETQRLPLTNLEGEYQQWNAATAEIVARALGPRWRISDAAIARGLKSVTWPGRWQRLEVRQRLLILDTSHNPEGAAVLDANLEHLTKETGRRCTVVVGVLGSDRARALIEVIAKHAQEIHVVAAPDPRACTTAELRSFVPPSFRGEVVRGDLERYFPGGERCDLGAPGDVIVVTGSIYLVGDILRRLEAKA